MWEAGQRGRRRVRYGRHRREVSSAMLLTGVDELRLLRFPSADELLAKPLQLRLGISVNLLLG
jgi:hypothetical protein